MNKILNKDKMKKFLVSVVIFLTIAWGIGELIKVSKPNVPEYDRVVIDSLYSNVEIKNRLGELKSFEFRYDSIASDYSATKFTIAVGGKKQSFVWQGHAVKIGDKISILDLKEIPD